LGFHRKRTVISKLQIHIAHGEITWFFTGEVISDENSTLTEGLVQADGGGSCG
jgi:hypothetical protein